MRAQVARAERRVEGPSRVHTAGDQRRERKSGTDNKNVPAQQVDLGKCQVLGSDHDREQEVAKSGGHGRNQEEENHVHAVHGKELVIGVGLEQLAVGGKQVQSNQSGENSAEKEKERDRNEIK